MRRVLWHLCSSCCSSGAVGVGHRQVARPINWRTLAQAEVERAVRRAGLERPPWQPLNPLEDLSARSQTGDGTSSLIADGVMVAEAGDAALFDPLATSEEHGRAAYQAALRVRDGLKDRKPLEHGARNG